jgi:hypothetical protein
MLDASKTLETHPVFKYCGNPFGAPSIDQHKMAYIEQEYQTVKQAKDAFKAAYDLDIKTVSTKTREDLLKKMGVFEARLIRLREFMATYNDTFKGNPFTYDRSLSTISSENAGSIARSALQKEKRRLKTQDAKSALKIEQRRFKTQDAKSALKIEQRRFKTQDATDKSTDIINAKVLAHLITQTFSGEITPADEDDLSIDWPQRKALLKAVLTFNTAGAGAGAGEDEAAGAGAAGAGAAAAAEDGPKDAEQLRLNMAGALFALTDDFVRIGHNRHTYHDIAQQNVGPKSIDACMALAVEEDSLKRQDDTDKRKDIDNAAALANKIIEKYNEEQHYENDLDFSQKTALMEAAQTFKTAVGAGEDEKAGAGAAEEDGPKDVEQLLNMAGALFALTDDFCSFPGNDDMKEVKRLVALNQAPKSTHARVVIQQKRKELNIVNEMTDVENAKKIYKMVNNLLGKDPKTKWEKTGDEADPWQKLKNAVKAFDQALLATPPTKKGYYNNLLRLSGTVSACCTAFVTSEHAKQRAKKQDHYFDGLNTVRIGDQLRLHALKKVQFLPFSSIAKETYNDAQPTKEHTTSHAAGAASGGGKKKK